MYNLKISKFKVKKSLIGTFIVVAIMLLIAYPKNSFALEPLNEKALGVAKNSAVFIYSPNETGATPTEADKTSNSLIVGLPLMLQKTDSPDWYYVSQDIASEVTNTQNVSDGFIHADEFILDQYSNDNTRHTPLGIVLESKQIVVYNSPDTNADILETYSSGACLQFRQYNSDWYVGVWKDNNNPQGVYGFVQANKILDESIFSIQNENAPDFGRASIYAITNSDCDLLNTPCASGQNFKTLQEGNLYRFTPFNENYSMAYFKDPATNTRRLGFIESKNITRRDNHDGEMQKLRATSKLNLMTSPGASSSYGSINKNSYFKAEKFNKDWYIVSTTVSNTSRNTFIPAVQVITCPDLYVFLDVGHGMGNSSPSSTVFDPGAVSGNYREYDCNKEVAYNVASKLDAYNIQYFLNDAGGYFAYRDDNAVNRGCNRFVSIHFNASQNKNKSGFQIYTNKNRRARSIALRDKIDSELLHIRGAHRSNTKASWVGNFGVLMSDHKNMPSVLVEVAYIDNATNMRHYKNNSQAYADAIAKGIYNSADI